LRDFGFNAYSAALDFYSRHHADAGALEAYTTAARHGFDVPADRDSIEAFAYHLSEVLRLAGSIDVVSEEFYRTLADAANDHITSELLRDCDTPEFLTFALGRMALRGKGGAK
jgi:hypothetical protein